jgi:hypothetical protein
MRRVGLAALVLLPLLGAVACGARPETVASASTPSSTSAAPTTTNDPRPPCAAKDVKVTGGLNAKPKVTIPDNCAPPTSLLTRDLVAGDGATKPGPGATLQVFFDLVAWSTKQDVDSSWAHTPMKPITVMPSDPKYGPVVKGLAAGLVDVSQGSRRLVIVPPSQGYGDKGAQGVKPNETLVFVVDTKWVVPNA